MSMTLFERLMAVRTGGGVERCHGVLHHGSYSVAAHSWGVATLMYLLWPKDFERLAIYCLMHDVPEAWVGDIPATTKFYCSEIKQECDRLEEIIFDRLNLPNDARLSVLDRAKLKSCDSLELYVWAKEQVCIGNQHANSVVRQLEIFFTERPLLPEADSLYGVLRHGCVEHATDGLIKEITQ